MDEKRLRKIINNPRHIPSIFNYCDSWCERCRFSLRCSVFAMQQLHDDKRQGGVDPDFWPRLDALAPLADELLHPDQSGLAPPKDPRFNNIGKKIDNAPIGAAAKRYMEFAHEFVQRNDPLKTSWQSPEPLPVSPAEAFDVIAFYHFFITVKLARALDRDDIDEQIENDPELADMPKDSDGSVKIALIAIDRSLIAWAILAKIPTLTPTALPALATLDRLRRRTERQFPKARHFQRPGFDTTRFK